MKIVLTTCNEIPNGTDDDRILSQEFTKVGHSCEFKIWDDPNVNWKAYDVCLLRSTWDYHRRLAEFNSWLQNVNANCLLLNPLCVVNWNYSKRYMAELHEKGAPIVPTHFGEDLESTVSAIKKIHQTFPIAIIKPEVSATSDLTFQVPANLIQNDPILQILNRGQVLVQPYLKSVTTDGEISLIFYFNKTWHYSHSVIKTPKQGDYRVQGEFGGRSDSIEADASLVSMAQESLKLIPKDALYARVDFLDFKNSPKIGEIELIEPELFFRFSSDLAKKIVSAVENKFSR